MSKKIKIQVHPHADEAAVMAAIQAEAASANSSANPHAAQQIRDADGKLISVLVNLPTDVSQGNLQNATNAINGNPGVAVATPSGVLIPYGDFTTLVEDTAYTQYGDPASAYATLFAQGNTIGTGQIVGAAAADSEGGAGSALRFEPSNDNGVWNGTEYSYASTFNLRTDAYNIMGMSSFEAFKFEGKFSYSTGGALGNVQTFRRVEVAFGDIQMQLTAVSTNPSTTFELFLKGSSPFDTITVDTGIAIGDKIEITNFQYVPELALLEVTVNGTRHYLENVFQGPVANMDVLQFSRQLDSSATLDVKDLVVDDCFWTLK